MQAYTLGFDHALGKCEVGVPAQVDAALEDFLCAIGVFLWQFDGEVTQLLKITHKGLGIVRRFEHTIFIDRKVFHQRVKGVLKHNHRHLTVFNGLDGCIGCAFCLLGHEQLGVDCRNLCREGGVGHLQRLGIISRIDGLFLVGAVGLLHEDTDGTALLTLAGDEDFLDLLEGIAGFIVEGKHNVGDVCRLVIGLADGLHLFDSLWRGVLGVLGIVSVNADAVVEVHARHVTLPADVRLAGQLACKPLLQGHAALCERGEQLAV